MTYVTCRLTAKNRDQLRNSTLGNRVWATFTFLLGWMNYWKKNLPIPAKSVYLLASYAGAIFYPNVQEQLLAVLLNGTKRTAIMRVLFYSEVAMH